MSWWATAPGFLLLLSILVPGVLIAAAAGARGIAALTAAPALSVGLIGVAGVVGGLVGAPWTLWWIAVCGVIVAVAAWLLARHVGSPGRRSRVIDQWPGLVGLLAGAVFAAVVIGQRLKSGIDRPDHISQRYDNVFHLNAVRYVLETDNASTLTLGRMLAPTNTVAIYPSAWHSTVALVAGWTGLEIPVASNIMNITVAAVVWPLSCMFLSYVLFGARLLPLAATGLLSACFASFPLALFEFGPLFPNMLSYALLPVAIGFLAALCRLGHPTGISPGGLVVGLVGSSAALGTAQPNGLAALLAFFVPIGLTAWLRWWRSATRPRSRKSLVIQAAVLLGSCAAFIAVWSFLLLPFNARDPFTTGGAALGEALTGTASSTTTSWAVAVAMLLGVAVLATSRWSRWLLGCFAVATVLYVVVASEPRGPLRMALTGAWYQDAPRLAALLPVVSVVVAVAGTVWLLDRITGSGAVLRMPARLRVFVPAVAGAAILAFLVPAAFSDGVEEDSVAKVKRAFSFTPEYADVLTIDERALIERLPDLVEPGSVLGVNPWNGGSLAYSYTGIEVSQYHMGTPPAALATVARSVDQANAGSAACTRTRELGIDYVLDFGSDYLLDFEGAFLYPAFDDAEDAKYQLVDQVGAAKLFRFENCSVGQEQ